MSGYNDDHGQRFHASYNFDVGQDELNFQTFGDASQVYDSNPYLNPANSPSFQGNIFTPAENIGTPYSGTENFDDEPPLLEGE
ncbi:hypothetical protein V9T40_002383 [Parthenolecanium corni]|uniref:Uncharacterized protein n=1 Tax=Parthenolecanium corni TaxID=536013 RepID=A0AAN9TIT0_9HEMI